MSQRKYRLVTRSDFDGLVCAVLLRELDLIDDISFVHPKDVQDGRAEIGEDDITTNLPYSPDAYLVFDHHVSEMERVRGRADNHVIDPAAPSAARVVYEFFGGQERFPNVSAELMRAVDQADSADYSLDDILYPSRWTLLNFIMDARTGLGRFREFRISNYQLMMELIEFCREHSVEEILDLADVKERVDLYFQQEPMFKQQLKACTTVHGNLVVLDLRWERLIHAGNRFMVYALYPDTNISMHVLWGKQRQNTVFAVGKSILNRTSQTNVGSLMLEYGGGGHAAAGTCQVSHTAAPRVMDELIRRITADG